MHDRVRRVIGCLGVGFSGGPAAAPAAPAAGGRSGPVAVLLAVFLAIILGRIDRRGPPPAAASLGVLAVVRRGTSRLVFRVSVLARGAAALAVAAAAPAPALARRDSRAVLAVVIGGLGAGLIGSADVIGSAGLIGSAGVRGCLHRVRRTGGPLPAGRARGARTDLRRLEDHQRRQESGRQRGGGRRGSELGRGDRTRSLRGA